MIRSVVTSEMAESDKLEDIRQRKAEQLRETVASDSPTTPQESSQKSTPEEPIQIQGTDQLSDIIEEYQVVLADFHADWCGPCQMLAPVIEELAADTPAAVVKIDIDANQSLAGEFGIQGVPTVLVFAEGTPAEQLVGVREKHHYEQLIEQYAD